MAKNGNTAGVNGDGGGTSKADPADAMTRAHKTDAAAETARTTETDDPTDRPSLQEAFARSLKQHSKPAGAGATRRATGAEDAGDEEASTETEDDADADAGDEGDDEDDADDQADTRRTARTAAPEKKGTDDALLTDAEYEALEEQHKGDPKALRRALEAAYTVKTQALARQRVSAERAEQYAGLIDAIEGGNPADLEAALRLLAEEGGIDLAKLRTATSTETTAAERAAAVADASADMLAEFRKDLGPDLDYLADGLMPAVKKMVERLTGTIVNKEVAPLRDRAKKSDEQTLARENEVLFDTFTKEQPEWKQYEDRMFELSQEMQPAKTMKPIDYLRKLYKLAAAEDTTATRESTIEAEVAKRLEKRLKKTERAAEAADERVDDVGERQVRRKGPANPTFEEAAAAARRGEVWTD